jgi:hypothetical protein
MPAVKKVFTWDQGQKQHFNIPTGINSFTIRACGAGGGGAAGPAAGGGKRPGSAGGGGAGAALQTTTQQFDNAGFDSVEVTLGAGGPGGTAAGGGTSGGGDHSCAFKLAQKIRL